MQIKPQKPFKIEIRYNERNGLYELWQHFLNVPKDIIYPVNYSNFIDFNRIKKSMLDKAIKQFNVNFHQINFTVDKW